MDGSTNIAEKRFQSIRNLYGQDLSDSDCMAIVSSLAEYASTLMEIAEDLREQTPNNNPAAEKL